MSRFGALPIPKGRGYTDLNLSTIWIIASFSFVVALSGALVAGPLLTYTIMKTLETGRRGSLIGAVAISGHAVPVYLGGRLIYDLLKGKVVDVFLNRHTGESTVTGHRLPHAFIGGDTRFD